MHWRGHCRPTTVFAVKEIFYTLQGEGLQVGRPAVFCRFAGCNLWSGREQDRTEAACNFCDTDFVGTDGINGGKYADDGELAFKIARLWPAGKTENRLVVFTGGEPLLQLNASLIRGLHALGFRCAVETNGTIETDLDLDWICVSPKSNAPVRLTHADEIKLVYPQPDAPPERFENFPAVHFFLQPMDNADKDANTASAIDYCKANPKWRLSVQTHKMVGIP